MDALSTGCPFHYNVGPHSYVCWLINPWKLVRYIHHKPELIHQVIHQLNAIVWGPHIVSSSVAKCALSTHPPVAGCPPRLHGSRAPTISSVKSGTVS